jgi:hypothetical protein
MSLRIIACMTIFSGAARIAVLFTASLAAPFPAVGAKAASIAQNDSEDVKRRKSGWRHLRDSAPDEPAGLRDLHFGTRGDLHWHAWPRDVHLAWPRAVELRELGGHLPG